MLQATPTPWSVSTKTSVDEVDELDVDEMDSVEPPSKRTGPWQTDGVGFSDFPIPLSRCHLKYS